MKISEYSQFQQDSLRQHFFNQMNANLMEVTYFQQAFNKLILVGNSSAIFLVSAYFGTLVSKNLPTSGLVLPFSVFLLGLIFAAYSIWYSMAIMGQAYSNNTRQYMEALVDQKDIEEIITFSFSESGAKRLRQCHWASFIAFIMGSLLAVASVSDISFSDHIMQFFNWV